jgi:O-antigen ligase
MKNSKRLVTLLLIGIALSSFIFSPFILDFTLTPRFITLAGIAVISFILLLISRTQKNVHIDLTLFFFILYAGFCSLSLFWSNTISESLFESAKVMLWLFLISITYFSLKHEPVLFRKGFLWVSILITALASAVAMYQFSKADRSDKEFLYIISSIHGHKNLYSSFIFINLFFLIRGFYSEKGYLKVLSAICILVSLLTIILLKTKAVWIGAAITLVLFLSLRLLKNSKIKFPFKLIFVGNLIAANLFFLVVLPWVVHEQVGNYKEKGIGMRAQRLDTERLVLWEKTYETFKKIPLIGVGMGNWQINYTNVDINGLYRGDDLNYTFQRPHNDLLWILSETGIIGFNLFFISISLVMIRLLKAISDRSDQKETFFEMTLCFSFISGFYLISFFDFPKERIEHLIWIAVLIGTAYYFVKKNEFADAISTVRTKPLLLSLIFVFAGIIWIGYLRCKGEYFVRKMYDAKAMQKEELAIEEGYKAFSFAYTIDPTSVPIHWYTGNCYAKLGNNVNAQKDLLIAFKYNPYNRNVLNDLASSYAIAGDLEKAKKYYLESARISPRFDDPKLNLTAIYIQGKNYLAADTTLRSLFHDSEKRTQYQTMVNDFLGKEVKNKSGDH